MVGVASAFFAEYLNTTIRLPSDIQENLNLPLLGFVPAIPATVRSFANKGKIAQLASRSGPAEAYRSLRTELLLRCAPDRACRTVMVTSTNPKEGKTTVATNLAITMAQAGYRVLLIDADLRKPSVHEIFRLENDHGLSTLLSEAGEARVYIKKTDEVENLHVLPGGPAPPNPAELLGSRKMRTLMAEASERYDMVVVDASPVLGVADANILGTMVDAVILVIQASKAKRTHVLRARNQLQGVNAHLVGAVLNNVRGSRGDYYYYRRYYSVTQIRGIAEQADLR
jgi:capsular exopolysaccharide synthesis family protein